MNPFISVLPFPSVIIEIALITIFMSDQLFYKLFSATCVGKNNNFITVISVSCFFFTFLKRNANITIAYYQNFWQAYFKEYVLLIGYY